MSRNNPLVLNSDKKLIGQRRALGYACQRKPRSRPKFQEDRITHVPYRGGAPSVTDLAAGNLDFMVSNLPECTAQIQGGRLRPLAITSAARHPLVPDVPTVREAGSPELEMTSWTAMMTNVGVPAPILAKLEADTLAAICDPDASRRARDGGFMVEAWNKVQSAASISAPRLTAGPGWCRKRN